MSRATLWVCVLLVACPGRRDPSDAPRRWEEDRTVTGDAARGFGASVALVGERLFIGQPWHGPGQVLDETGVVLDGVDGDRQGESLLGGERLVVGSPGRGGAGAVLDASGQVLLPGQPGESLGGAPVLHGDEIVALTRSGVRGASTSWQSSDPLWSLVSARLSGAEPVLIAGLVSGGIAWSGSTRGAAGALGRGIEACDLDADGDDDLVLADPLDGRLHIHLIDDIGQVDLERPTRELVLGAGAGRTVRCFNGGLLVGAPDLPTGGAVAWIRRPLGADLDDVVWIRGAGGSRLGHAIAVGAERVAVGDPGRGEVKLLKPVP